MEIRKGKLNLFLLALICFAVIFQPVGSAMAAAANVDIKVTNMLTGDIIFEQQGLQVADSQVIDTDGKLHTFSEPNALGALITASQSGDFPIEVVDSAYGLYVKSIAGIQPSGWDGWSYMVNSTSPWLAMADYQITDGDRILVYYGWPYKVQVDKANVQIGEEVTISAFVHDGAQWVSYPNSELKVGDADASTDDEGKYTVSFDETGAYNIYLVSYGWPNCPEITVTVSDKPVVNQKTPVSGKNKADMARKALSYLKTLINKRGLIDNVAVSGWSAMAFAANGQYSQSLKNNGADLLSGIERYRPADCNDYSRQALAVVSTGGNPFSSGGLNLIKKIRSYYKEGQFGNKALINDDIFACLALLASGSGKNDRAIANSIKYILKTQRADGGFSYAAASVDSDIDDSAAALQLFSSAKKKGYKNLDAAIAKLSDYISSSQNTDGGFPYTPGGQFSDSNVASTSWALMALNSAGIDTDKVRTDSGNSGFHYFKDLQKSDGSFPWSLKDKSKNNQITAYAVVALLGKYWPVTMKPYKQKSTSTSILSGDIGKTDSSNSGGPASSRADAQKTNSTGGNTSPGNKIENISNENLTAERANDKPLVKSKIIKESEPKKTGFLFGFLLFTMLAVVLTRIGIKRKSGEQRD